MIKTYMESAILMAKYKILDDQSWYAEISGFSGIWANGNSVEECRNELMEVLEEWIILKIRDHEQVPVINNIDINIKAVPA